MEKTAHWTNEWSKILIQLTPTGWLPPSGTPSRMVADFAADTMRDTRLFDPTVVSPDFTQGETGAELMEIARSSEAAAREYPHRSVAKCGPEAYRILEEAGVYDYASRLLGRPVEEEFDAFFLYYKEGDFTALHVDNGTEYPLNLLTCMHRVRPEGEGRRSATYFMESSDKVTARDLDPGQALWFHACAIPHGRTPLGPGEEVIIMTLSFREK
jgi:hypothetical protein